MNGKGKRTMQGADSEGGAGFALGLALVTIFIPLPFFVLTVVLFVFTIVRLRASPLPEAFKPARFPGRPCLRSPPA